MPGAGSLLDFGLGQLSSAIDAGRSRRMWRMQNEYNHPRAQMQRLSEAGLNPALIYGSGSGGAAGNAGSPSVPSTGKMSSYMGNALQAAQLDLVQAQADRERENTLAVKLKNDLQKETNKYLLEQPTLEFDHELKSPFGDTLPMKVRVPSGETRQRGLTSLDYSNKQYQARIASVRSNTEMRKVLTDIMLKEAQTATQKANANKLEYDVKIWEAFDEFVNTQNLDLAAAGRMFLKLLGQLILKR